MPRLSMLVILVLTVGVGLISLSAQPAPTTAQAETDVMEQNLKLARQVIEDFMNAKNLAVIPALYDKSVKVHFPPARTALSFSYPGRQEFFKGLFQAFPDMAVTINHIAAGDDVVFIHYTFKGTHHDWGMVDAGGMPIRPSGKVETWRGVFIFRFTDGKIVEEWWYDWQQTA